MRTEGKILSSPSFENLFSPDDMACKFSLELLRERGRGGEEDVSAKVPIRLNQLSLACLNQL